MNWKCFIKGYQFEIIKEFPYLDIKGNEIGIVIVSRCKICGEIRNKVIYNTQNYGK